MVPTPKNNGNDPFKEAPKTKGEKAFNYLNYWGMGWLVNTAISVGMAWVLNDSKVVKPRYDKFLDRFSKSGAQKGKLGEIVTMGALMGGGFAVLWPMKKAEDKKLELVKKLDKMLDGEEAVQSEANQKAYARIEAEPKQGWVSLTASRIAGIAVVFIAQAGLNSRDVLWSAKAARFTDKLFNRGNKAVIKQIDEATKTATELGAKEAERQAKAVTAAKRAGKSASEIEAPSNTGLVRGAQKVADNERLQTKLFNYANLDLAYSFGLATLLYGFSRMFVGFGNNDKPDEKAQTNQTNAVNGKNPKQTTTPVTQAQRSDKPLSTIEQTQHRGRAAEPDALALSQG